ncbi:YceH family protein [Glaciecola sp. SC05]|uniref:YceH family protein n=1 Tax=Glaciecola sp. SC05 TaxID=1987355 RepID=UPI003527C063
MLIQLSSDQARVIGVLIEKEITTPDQYPLSLNALTLGCNQKSSREPIMQLTESDVQNILDELADKNLLFEHQSSGSRVVKYKHRFCNTEFSSLKFSPQQLGIICVLLLRGPQTPGELRTRTNRLADFTNVNELEACLSELSNFNGDTLVVKLPREPGKREARYAHLFCGNEGLQASGGTNSSLPAQSAGLPNGAVIGLEEALNRIKRLEEQIDALTKRLDDMQETLDILSS